MSITRPKTLIPFYMAYLIYYFLTQKVCEPPKTECIFEIIIKKIRQKKKKRITKTMR